MDWYVLRTHAQAERRAAAELRRAGLRVYLPRRSFETRNRRTRAVTVKSLPLLIGYLFARFPEEMLDGRGVPPFALARACPSVGGILSALDARGERAPFPVPDSVIAEFMRRQRAREFGRPAVDDPHRRAGRLTARFPVGRVTRVAAGPLEALLATIEGLRDDGSVDATVTLLGRATRVNFEFPEQALAAE